MHRYHTPGFYWYRSAEDQPWQVVKLRQPDATAPVTVQFFAAQKTRDLTIEELKGELVGPLNPPKPNVLPFPK